MKKLMTAKYEDAPAPVWLHSSIENGIVHFRADSDALLVRGS